MVVDFTITRINYLVGESFLQYGAAPFLCTLAGCLYLWYLGFGYAICPVSGIAKKAAMASSKLLTIFQ